MNEFDKEKTENFNRNKKRETIGKLDEILDSINDMDNVIRGIKSASDDVELLAYAKEVHKKLNMLEIRYMGLLTLRKELGAINENEYTRLLNAISIDKYEKVYPLIRGIDVEAIIREVENSTFLPEKGTSGYCDCKGYYDIGRIDMGKMIKKDLLNEYPELNFSVKTAGTHQWNERALVRITETAPEILNQYGGFKDEFIRELYGFLNEYYPRMKIGVDTYRL